MSSVWIYGWMDASLAPERFDGFYSYSVFNTVSIVGRSPVISAPKIRVLLMRPIKSKWRFS
jgi:hypothetical protein